jgi:hypothetical protein
VKTPTNEELKPLGIIAAGLFVLALLGVVFTDTSAGGMFSLAFALFAYLAVPGYFVLLNFPYTTLERVILGMIVSTALVPAVLYTANLLGLAVSRTNVLIAIVLIVAAAILYRKE